VPVIPTAGRSVNPTQVGLFDGRFVAVTKEGDWWGTTVYLDTAPAPEGPWTTYTAFALDPPCDECNTYFASIVPYGADAGSFIVTLSVNTWSGTDLDHYVPMFLRVDAPRALTAAAAHAAIHAAVGDGAETTRLLPSACSSSATQCASRASIRPSPSRRWFSV
jgi:hypothetical protein